MNETITLLKNRKSIRKHTEIIKAALYAPSAGAAILYSIIEVADQSLKDKLSKMKIMKNRQDEAEK